MVTRRQFSIRDPESSGSLSFSRTPITRPGGTVTLAEKVSDGNTNPVNKVRLAGFSFDNLTEPEVVDHIIRESEAGRGGWVLTPNIDFCRKASRDPELTAQLRGASLTVADGMPLLWAAKANRTPIVARVTGSSLIFTVSEAAAATSRSVYFLGGAQGVPELAGQNLANRYPGLKVAGSDAPPFAFEESAEAIGQVEAKLRSAAPDIVYVGLGFPKQEKLIIELRKVLRSAWFIGCGGAIPIVAGSVPRAPEWMQRAGLEWLHRLSKEPKRLFRRYVIEDLPFAITLLVRVKFSHQTR
jgi:N-acetylglucosaminyldiphosphoundecaprenol N-acetyl-beta-D-mannosaminyltransferase